MERFIGILIEHHAGSLPFWLSPVQAVVAPIVSDADDYAREVCALLKSADVRADTDLRNEKINYKIREHAMHKVPVIVVVGRKEAEEKTVTLRFRGVEAQETVALADVVQRLKALRSEEHTSELQSLMRISYAVFCLKKKKNKK